MCVSCSDERTFFSDSSHDRVQIMQNISLSRFAFLQARRSKLERKKFQRVSHENFRHRAIQLHYYSLIKGFCCELPRSRKIQWTVLTCLTWLMDVLTKNRHGNPREQLKVPACLIIEIIQNHRGKLHSPKKLVSVLSLMQFFLLWPPDKLLSFLVCISRGSYKFLKRPKSSQ